MDIKVLNTYIKIMRIYPGYNYTFKGLKQFNKYIKKYNIKLK